MAKGDDAKPKPSGKKKVPDKDEKPQAERFIEAARRLGADESGKTSEDAFNLIVPEKSR